MCEGSCGLFGFNPWHRQKIPLTPTSPLSRPERLTNSKFSIRIKSRFEKAHSFESQPGAKNRIPDCFFSLEPGRSYRSIKSFNDVTTYYINPSEWLERQDLFEKKAGILVITYGTYIFWRILEHFISILHYKVLRVLNLLLHLSG